MTDDMPERRPRGRPRSMKPAAEAGTVQSLERGMALLRIVAAADGLTLTEVSRVGGLPPSTTHRMLTTLQQAGMVEFDETGQLWFVGVETFRIGSAFLRRRKLAERGRVILQDLMTTTGETANLALAEAGGVVFVSQAETHEPIRAFFRPGTRSPYHASGVGKAVLAFMDPGRRDSMLQRISFERFTAATRLSAANLMTDLVEARQNGFALDDEERNTGMRCIAAPVFNELGDPIGGLSVSGPTVRVDDRFIDRHARAVVAAADALTAAIGGIRP
jgi:IclR family transcriptional regulator, acetate operon repressor